MFGTSLSATAASLLNLRFFRADFFSRLWLFIAFRRRSLPAPVTLKRFFAALLVFCFGISRNSGFFRVAQQHHHVASVEDGSGLDHPDLLDVLGEPHQQVTAPLRMGRLAPPEHDRDLDLRALVQEAHDMALLGVVVVDPDLRPELDLLDVDLDLVLSRELRLLLLLVAVLAVVHHPGYRRIGLRGHLDEVEVLREGVLHRVLRRFDPDLRAVLVDQPDVRGANPFVDPRLLNDWTRGFRGATSGPQEALTKSCLSSSIRQKSETAASSGRMFLVIPPLNLLFRPRE